MIPINRIYIVLYFLNSSQPSHAKHISKIRICISFYYIISFYVVLAQRIMKLCYNSEKYEKLLIFLTAIHKVVYSRTNAYFNMSVNKSHEHNLVLYLNSIPPSNANIL